MPSEPVVSVRGEAVLEVAPEIAVVSVTVMARDKDRRRAVEALAERARGVTALAKGHGDAVESLQTDPVSVHPEFRDGKPRERITGYVARLGVQVTVGDFAVLGPLVPALAQLDMVSVTGPAWLLRPGSPVYREARLAAARDATERARDYAQAFGGRITGLVEAADEGLLTDTRESYGGYRATALMRVPAGDDGDGIEFDFEPAKQTVRAQVQARFTMSAPPFSA
jgi:uncharacterized protein